jgi:Ca-activated chloride channel homolog
MSTGATAMPPGGTRLASVARNRGGRIRKPAGRLPSSVWGVAATLVCAMIVSQVLAVAAMAGPAENAYHKGNLEKARRLYEARLHEEPGDLQTRYNLGNVLYRSKQLKDAEEAYLGTLASPDPALRSRAAHNLGNARLQAGEIDGAIAAYVEALRAEPGNADTKHNLELALRMREMKPPQQQPQDQKQEKNQKDQKDQKQNQQQSGKQDQEQQGQQQEQPGQQDKEQQEQAKQQQSTAADENEKRGQSQPPPAPGDYTPEEAQRVLDGLAQEERDLLADRWRTLGQNVRVEKDW